MDTESSTPATRDAVDILAVDIERVNNKVVAIGACIMAQETGEITKRFKTIGFFPSLAGGRDYHEFWCRDDETKNMLKSLVYSGHATFEQRQEQMIDEFQLFRLDAEQAARERGRTHVLVVDSSTDLTFLSMMIMKHLDANAYLPYSAGVQASKEVHPFWGELPTQTRAFLSHTTFLTASMQHMLLSMVDPSYSTAWGKSKQVRRLYGIPKPDVNHDHDPVNDAICIAWDYKHLMDIAAGVYTLANAE